MKRIVYLLLLMVASIPMEAQIVSSRTFGEKKKKPVTWYARAGVSINNLAGPAKSLFNKSWKEEKEDFEEHGDKLSGGACPLAGYDFLVGFRKEFPVKNLYWGMEFGFGTRGGLYSFSEEYEHETRKSASSVKSYNVKYIPFQIGYMLPIKDKFSLDAHLGWFASFDFAHKAQGYEFYKEDMEDVTEDTEFYRFDTGLKLGVGVWYDRFNLDISWQRGFMPYLMRFPWGEDDWYGEDGNRKPFQSSNIIISLGVSF